MANSRGLIATYLKKINSLSKNFITSIQYRQADVLNRLLETYVTNKDAFQRGYLALIILFFTRQIQKTFNTSSASKGTIKASLTPNSKNQTSKNATSASSTSRAKLDQKFFVSIKKILKIIIPGIHSFEFRILAVHSVLLVARTALSVVIASLDGEIVSNIVRLRFKQFMRGIAKWLLIAIPAALTNSSLEYLQQLLSIRFRKRLSTEIHELYFQNHNFYAVPNLDSRLQNVDQVIVVDVQKFAHSLSTLYSNITKPVLDTIVYNVILARSVGLNTLLALSVIVQISTGILRASTPPFGTLVAQEQKLEGDLHHAHARVIDNAEEIALWKGHSFEKKVVQQKYSKLIQHVNRVFRLNIFYEMMEDFVIKYFWGAAGLVVCAAPVFAERILTVEEIRQNRANNVFFFHSNAPIESSLGSRTKDFVANRRLLLSSSDAVGRVIYTYKELVQLSGYTKRVSELLEVLDDVSKGKFIKNQISSGNQGQSQDQSQGQSEEKAMPLPLPLPASLSSETKRPITKSRGKVVESEYIFFDKVPIVSPTGDVLIKELSFAVQPGMNLLVLGPNGCGKSSMFRILGGLWPTYGGILNRPSPEKIFYLPQKPYMCAGTLRDQIIYPHSILDLEQNGTSDSDILSILRILQLDKVIAREGGFDAIKEWRDVLSGGDKQKIAMARLYYHKPKYAIMDECTSAVSLEIENIMYTHASDLGITMLTVSHRQSLWKYHNYLLEFDGQGNYLFTKFDPEQRLELLSEKQKLEEQNNLYLDLELRIGQLSPNTTD